jgi:transglutaminase-like putative cysteine protease
VRRQLAGRESDSPHDIGRSPPRWPADLAESALEHPTRFDAILADSGITVVRSGVQMPRMNAIMKRWARTSRTELPDRTLTCNQRHLTHTLREYEDLDNAHRPQHGMTNARPPAPRPEPISDQDELTQPRIHRRDRLGGLLHEYEHAA